MKRGPKPKPAEKAELQGNPGRRKIPKEATEEQSAGEAAAAGELLPPGSAGEDASPVNSEVTNDCPPELTGDEQKRAWREVVLPYLRSVRWIKKSDYPMLVRLCVWTATFWEAYRSVQTDGVIYQTTSKHSEKMIRTNPAVEVMRKAEDRLLGLEDRLGLNPAARMRIAAALAGGAWEADKPRPSAPARDEASAPDGQEGAGRQGSVIGVLAGGDSVH